MKELSNERLRAILGENEGQPVELRDGMLITIAGKVFEIAFDEDCIVYEPIDGEDGGLATLLLHMNPQAQLRFTVVVTDEGFDIHDNGQPTESFKFGRRKEYTVESEAVERCRELNRGSR